MMRLRVCLLACLTSFFVAGQTFPFREYSVLDGLVSDQIINMMQDSRGFFWILTKNGVSRFDGLEFKSYGRKEGLLNLSEVRLTEDACGRIWLLQKQGLAVFEGNAFNLFAVPDSLGLPNFNQMKSDSAEGFLILGKDKDHLPLLLYFSEGHYLPLILPPRLQHMLVGLLPGRRKGELLLMDNQDSIFSCTILSTGGSGNPPGKCMQALFRLTPVGKFKPPYYINNSIIKQYYDLLTGIPDFAGVKVTPDWNNSVRKPFQPRWPYEKKFFGVLYDRDSTYWVYSESGLRRLVSPAFIHYTVLDGLVPEPWSVVEDAIGNIWFASFTGRLQRYDGLRFSEIPLPKNPKIRFFDIGARQMSDGSLWFTHWDGIAQYQHGGFSPIRYAPAQQTEYIYEDPVDSSILIAGGFCFTYHHKGQTQYFPQFNGIDTGYVRQIARDCYGLYWLATSKAAYRFDGQRFMAFDTTQLPSSNFISVLMDSSGTPWLGGLDGLFWFDRAANRFHPALPPELNEAVYALALMDGNRILLGRTRDLLILDIHKMKTGDPAFYRVYDRSDGFTGRKCRQNGILRTSKGTYWILTTDGAVYFDPYRLRINRQAPLLHFTSIECLDEGLNWKPAIRINLFDSLVADRFSFSYDKNNLRIHYLGISSENPEKVLYSYRIAGRKEQWSEPSSERTLVLSGLQPGTYLFQLKCCNSDGVWSGVKEISIQIVPAFWQTNSFRVGSILLIIIAVSILSVYITRRMQRTRERKRDLEREYARLQIGSILRQFDPHFTFNVIASVGYLILNGEKEKAYDYFVKLSNLLRSALREDQTLLKTLAEELEFIQNYCEIQRLRFGDRFDFSVSVASTVDTTRLIPKMMVQNFVENSLKYGIEPRQAGGSLEIDIRVRDGDLLIRISDNGPGLTKLKEEPMKGTGTGTRLIRQLISQANLNNPKAASISIADISESDPSKTGVLVEILIPEGFSFGF